MTLHVGAGTFQPVRVENIAEHKMHSEWCEVSPRRPPASLTAGHAGPRHRGRYRPRCARWNLPPLLRVRLPAVNCYWPAAETDIFITPGFEFQVVDRLVTNFHLPKSTLMMLVSAFAGYAHIRALYAHAIAQRYRFFSYGDAMLLTRPGHRPLSGVVHGGAEGGASGLGQPPAHADARLVPHVDELRPCCSARRRSRPSSS